MFDRCVVADWSARSAPATGRDSIWVGTCDQHGVRSENPSTRAAAMRAIRREVAAPGRVLVGVDFSLGYPQGFAAELGIGQPAWRHTWELVEHLLDDDERNANNRFHVASELNGRVGDPLTAGPFWGCPPSARSSVLTSTKVVSNPLPQWRAVETILRERGHRPFSSWQLLGAGSVGSQSLTGIAALAPMVRDVADDVDVWPFTSGFGVPGRRVVLAEVWPSLFPLESLAGSVKDDVQVRTVAAELFARAHDGSLAAWFAPHIDHRVDRRIVEAEEGWILGA